MQGQTDHREVQCSIVSFPIVQEETILKIITITTFVKFKMLMDSQTNNFKINSIKINFKIKEPIAKKKNIQKKSSLTQLGLSRALYMKKIMK
jgi:hypothetical protein